MTDTIKPLWAATIWSSVDNIYAELPSVNGHQAHTIRVDNSTEGLEKLLTMLNSRHTESTLGTKGDPTQFQIDKSAYTLVRRVGRVKFNYTEEQRTTAKGILRKLGLI